jgi:molybdenum cofactor cytidylyltransferase
VNHLHRPNRSRAAGARAGTGAAPVARGDSGAGSKGSGPVAGVVLAAGTSSRLGRNKLLLDVGGETLVHRTVRRVAAAGLDPVLVVVGHQADRVTAELAAFPCRPVVNVDYASGQSSSLKAGIAAVPPEAVAAVVVLADMPLVSAEMVATLADRYRRSAGGEVLAVVSDYGGVLAPPTLYDRVLFPELAAMDGPGCARRVLARHRERILTLSWPPEALADLDDEADLQRLHDRLAGPPAAPPVPLAPNAVEAEAHPAPVGLAAE